MAFINLWLCTTRSHCSFVFVSLSNHLCTSAAAASPYAEQRFMFYLWERKRQRCSKEVNTSYTTIIAMSCDRVEEGPKFVRVIAWADS